MIDLHAHTNISDGFLSDRELIKLAKEKGVTHLAITNHDTTKGLQKAIDIGKEYEVVVIPGIEISAYDPQSQKKAHILGLYVEPEHAALKKVCEPLLARRDYKSRRMVQKLVEKGYDITWERVMRHAGEAAAVYKQHIMHALLEQGYTNSIFGTLYHKLFSRGSQHQPQGIAYEAMEYIDGSLAIQAILAAGGLPVLAHPGSFHNFEIVPRWAEVGLAGIEVRHPSHTPLLEKRARELAAKFQLIMTGGSDHHGFYGDVQAWPGEMDMGAETIQALLERKQKASCCQ